MVVLIHCKFPGNIGLSLQAVARFAVPFFFMVSGYYCFKGGHYPDIYIVRKILHIAKITFIWYLFYCLFFVVENWLLHSNHTFDFSISHILKVFLFNEPSNVPPHFWFLFALLNVYLLFLFVNKFKIKKFAYVFSLIMFVVLIAMQQGMSLMGYSLKPYYFRNFLIEGFPFFMLGHFLHDKEGKWSVSNRLLLIIVFISALSSVVESFMFKRFVKVFLSTYPLVICLFLYAIDNPNRHQGTIQYIGKNLSLPIYILHWMVMMVVDRAIHHYGFEKVVLLQWMRPIIVVGTTLLLSVLYEKLFESKKT